MWNSFRMFREAYSEAIARTMPSRRKPVRRKPWEARAHQVFCAGWGL